jgi:Mce-associated membrane protein
MSAGLAEAARSRMTSLRGVPGRVGWLRAAWGLLAAAAVFAAWSGWSYWQAYRGASLSLATERDDVLRAGTAEIAALNTVNDQQIGLWQQRWLNASAGTLRAELRRTQAQSRQQIAWAHSSSQATVTAAALTSLDQHGGTAQLIASVQVQVTPDGGTGVTECARYQAGLTRTADGWKISTLTAIPASGG